MRLSQHLESDSHLKLCMVHNYVSENKNSNFGRESWCLKGVRKCQVMITAYLPQHECMSSIFISCYVAARTIHRLSLALLVVSLAAYIAARTI